MWGMKLKDLSTHFGRCHQRDRLKDTVLELVH